MTRLTTAVEDYFTGLRQVRASGGATGELSSYGPLGNLLNAVGATLKPKTFCVGELADQVGSGLGEYLNRALSHRARLVEPKDLAWLLASYARDALARVEAADDAPSLAAIRGALEEALGVRFEGEKGMRFFHSTLVQTLFYGVFSAWVLWARQVPQPTKAFNWREAVWHLRAPVMQALFQQLSQPDRLQPLGLVEVLDWTSAALERMTWNALKSQQNVQRDNCRNRSIASAGEMIGMPPA